MANPLLKMTLMLLSLFSAALVGQGLLDAEQSSRSSVTKAATNQMTHDAATGTDFYHEPGEAKGLPQSLPEARIQQRDTQSIYHKNATPTEAASSQQIQQRNKKNQRSFSFHYLDILEWMFAGRGEKAKRHQLQSPSTLHTW